MSQTVARAIEILELVARRTRTLGETAAHLDVHRSTALRLLRTLVDGGLVRHLPDGKYGVGYRLAGLAQLASEQFDLKQVAHPFLNELSQATGHTVHLASHDNKQIIYVDKVEPAATVRLYSQIGLPVPLHTAAASKAIMALLPRDRTLRMLENCTYEPYTSATIVSEVELLATLDRDAHRGWSTDDGEHEEYVNCIAAPIYDASGVVGAVSVTALKAVAGPAHLEELLPRLMTCANNISTELGWAS